VEWLFKCHYPYYFYWQIPTYSCYAGIIYNYTTVLTDTLGLTLGQACGSFSALDLASGQTGVKEMESQLTTLFFANALDSASAFTLSLIN